MRLVERSLFLRRLLANVSEIEARILGKNHQTCKIIRLYQSWRSASCYVLFATYILSEAPLFYSCIVFGVFPLLSRITFFVPAYP